jgi:hypothetical protein
MTKPIVHQHRRLLGILALVAAGVSPARAADGTQPAATEPFDYFYNSWSVIGLKDYMHGTRITPDNKLLLANDTPLRLRYGRNLDRLSRRQTKTLLDGWLPIVLLTTHDGDVQYEFTFWATPLPTANDWRAAFDWPTEGENYANWIRVRTTNTGHAPAAARLRLDLAAGTLRHLATCDAQLVPGAQRDDAWCVPFEGPHEGSFDRPADDAQRWLDRTAQFWRGLMANAARIEVPSPKATNTLLAAHVCQLIANDHGELHGGEGFYDQFYIRDGGYQIMELEEAGLFDAADKAVARYLTCQRPDGRFESQPGQLDANGQAQWVLWQYHKITGNRDWLARVYPQMQRAAEWTINARHQAPADSPFAGLLPAAVADGEYLWDGKHHIVGYDLWNLRGLLCTADAARILGKENEAGRLTSEAATYRAAIDAACEKTGLAHFPPSWEKDGTHWGNTETLWPTELFAPDDPRVSATIRHARHEHGGGFIEGTIQWLGRPGAIHPYLSAYTTMTCLSRGEHDAAVEDFFWYLLHSSATHAFPEGIYYKRRFAWSDTIPHVTGASNYALMLRHLLIHERPDELHLLTAAPDGWLAEGRKIVVERAPTHFGVMGLVVAGENDGVRVTFDPPRRNPPSRVVLHLPESRPLLNPIDGVETRSRPDQKSQWGLAHVHEIYLRDAPPPPAPIHGLVELPLANALPLDRCVMLDLSPLANTNPFTAPFGVANPGRFRFTDMPVGRVTVGGVAFQIIDPADNDGRGLIVLHSPKAPPGHAGPHEVQVSVGRAARRVFFLGNVHGWGAFGAPDGGWQTVARYEIHYADGTTQVLPLIVDRTTDDWTAPRQAAAEAYRGLVGNPWHLNVLGVTVRPVQIDRIVFRDLDTPAAPVLVAITLEQ